MPNEISISKITVRLDGIKIFNPTAVHAAMATAYRKLVWGTLGPFGENRPEPWPALSKSYAKRVRPQVPTLYRDGTLARSIQISADASAGHVGTDLDIAAYHQYGTARMPARLFFQFYRNGSPTLIAEETVAKAALEVAIIK
jgi:hypothetical protein